MVTYLGNPREIYAMHLNQRADGTSYRVKLPSKFNSRMQLRVAAPQLQHQEIGCTLSSPKPVNKYRPWSVVGLPPYSHSDVQILHKESIRLGAFCFSPEVLISVNVSLSGSESNRRIHIMGFKKNKLFVEVPFIQKVTAGLKTKYTSQGRYVKSHDLWQFLNVPQSQIQVFSVLFCFYHHQYALHPAQRLYIAPPSHLWSLCTFYTSALWM